MTLTKEAPRKRTLRDFMIADWRQMPDCHICGQGTVHYQCRVCDKGLHDVECMERAAVVEIEPNDPGRCVEAGCDRVEFARVELSGEMLLSYCEGHWYRYQASACPPPEGTCKCGYSVASPGVGYVGAGGWYCKRCGDLHTLREVNDGN